jgi:hypothetical protein
MRKLVVILSLILAVGSTVTIAKAGPCTDTSGCVVVDDPCTSSSGCVMPWAAPRKPA